MSRRRTNNDEIISLFPFLSILACVIGTLTLMITSLALSQTVQPTVSKEDQAAQAAAEKRIADFKDLRSQLADTKAELEKLQKEAVETEAAIKSLDDKKSANEKARQQQLDLQKKLDEKLAEIARLKKRIADLQKGLADLDVRIKELQAELKKRNDTPREAVVELQSRGTAHDIDPYFVECTGGSVVLLDGSEPKRLPANGLDVNPAFVAALETVKKSSKGSMIFLLRSDGVGAYSAAQRVADAAGVRSGKLPVPGKGRLDLGAYAPKKGGR